VLCCAALLCPPVSYSAGVSSENTCVGVVGLSAVVVPWAFVPHSGHAGITQPRSDTCGITNSKINSRGSSSSSSRKQQQDSFRGQLVSEGSCRCQHATLLRGLLHLGSAAPDNAFYCRPKLFCGGERDPCRLCCVHESDSLNTSWGFCSSCWLVQLHRGSSSAGYSRRCNKNFTARAAYIERPQAPLVPAARKLLPASGGAPPLLKLKCCSPDSLRWLTVTPSSCDLVATD
jgi:hypothetical protein